MANEPTTTVTGNLTADPEMRYTPTGRPVASFTIASTPRFPDRATGEWKDGETWFLNCSAWGDMAENVITSLSRGTAVVATGRLQARSWDEEAPGGGTRKRRTVELTVDDIGPSLRRASAKVTKVTREHAPSGGPTPAPAATSAGADPWSVPAPTPAGYSDEPPF
jgi:single-strand DNA-binding protein